MIQRFEQFTTAVFQIYRCVQRIKNTDMTELGLKGRHVMCLFFLSTHPEGLTASELCALCGEDKAAVSRAAAELEARGLLGREPAAGRRYRAKLTLTAAGQAAAEQVRAFIEAAVARGGAGLTDRQRREFYRALTKIAGNLQQICEEKDAT